MIKTHNFSKRAGVVNIPEATTVISTVQDQNDANLNLYRPRTDIPFKGRLPLEFDPPLRVLPGKFCFTDLREGCYTIFFNPNGGTFLGPYYRGTLRVEKPNGGIKFSGDFYLWWISLGWVLPDRVRFAKESFNVTELNLDKASDAAADTNGVIPVYPRGDYYSYLKGTNAQLLSYVPLSSPCTFSLNFEEFVYQHPVSGFNGSFPATPNRSIRFAMSHTDEPDHYEGRVLIGNFDLGSITMHWVSPYFRRAALEIHTLHGADAPQAVNDNGALESFQTIFASAGWDLSVHYAGSLNLPSGLQGSQDPNTCWPSSNSHELMESIPGYDPGELDSVWKARLLAIPATLGCSRGRMFDNGAGDLNDIGREGAVTHSHDGYPSTDSPNFGVAEGGLQRDFPRAFLRSAAHEVGHTFNQIHQAFEGGADNSVMTVTPSVANVLAGNSQVFPDDINLAFNNTVRGHLIHQPDPAIRPGGMNFFGAAVGTPQADQVNWLDQVRLEISAKKKNVCLGEPVVASWNLRNVGKDPVVVPETLDTKKMIARINVTDPQGKITFLRPVDIATCPHLRFKALQLDEEVSGSETVFWGQDGFVFQTPGTHLLEVILIWNFNGIHYGCTSEIEIWVEYPVSQADNKIASLMLDPEVGKAVATHSRISSKGAKDKIREAFDFDEKHPAIVTLKELGIVD